MADGGDDPILFPVANWDPKFLNRIPEAKPGRVAAIRLSPPPDVMTTRGELDIILANRDVSDFPARVPEIKLEDQNPPPSLFVPLDADTGGANTKTAVALRLAVSWSVPYIMALKQRFMRARPNFLDPRIQTVVPVPGHPAYPSGHSTQSHLMALIGFEISRDREIRGNLWMAADRIAQNREYAGLHYRSDSACGAELARQLLPFFLEDHRGDVADAMTEWPS